MGAWPHHLSWFNNGASPPSKYTRAQCADTTSAVPTRKRERERERDGWLVDFILLQLLSDGHCSPKVLSVKSAKR